MKVDRRLTPKYFCTKCERIFDSETTKCPTDEILLVRICPRCNKSVGEHHTQCFMCGAKLMHLSSKIFVVMMLLSLLLFPPVFAEEIKIKLELRTNIVMIATADELEIRINFRSSHPRFIEAISQFLENGGILKPNSIEPTTLEVKHIFDKFDEKNDGRFLFTSENGEYVWYPRGRNALGYLVKTIAFMLIFDPIEPDNFTCDLCTPVSVAIGDVNLPITNDTDWATVKESGVSIGVRSPLEILFVTQEKDKIFLFLKKETKEPKKNEPESEYDETNVGQKNKKGGNMQDATRKAVNDFCLGLRLSPHEWEEVGDYLINILNEKISPETKPSKKIYMIKTVLTRKTDDGMTIGLEVRT